jgi:hypothetical protein
MLLVRLLNDLPRLFLKLFVTLHEFFALWRDLGISSREFAGLLIEKGKSLAVVVWPIGVLRITRIQEVENSLSTQLSNGTRKNLKSHRLDRLGEGSRNGSRVC